MQELEVVAGRVRGGHAADRPAAGRAGRATTPAATGKAGEVAGRLGQRHLHRQHGHQDHHRHGDAPPTPGLRCSPRERPEVPEARGPSPARSTMLATADVALAQQRGGREHHQRDGGPVATAGAPAARRPPPIWSRNRRAQPERERRATATRRRCGAPPSCRAGAPGTPAAPGPSGLIAPEPRCRPRPHSRHAQLDRGVLLVGPADRATGRPAPPGPSGNDPWVFTQIQKTGISTQAGRPSSAASRVDGQQRQADQQRPRRPHRAAHADHEAGDHDPPDQRPRRPGQPPRHGRR